MVYCKGKHYWVRVAERANYEPAVFDGNQFFIPGELLGFLPTELHEIHSKVVFTTYLPHVKREVLRGEQADQNKAYYIDSGQGKIIAEGKLALTLYNYLKPSIIYELQSFQFPEE